MAARTNQLPADPAAAQAEVRRLSEALALAERDRQLLGYEIHDGLVQDLTAAAMHLESAGREARFSSAEMQENYAGGLRLLRESIAQARQLIRGLATVELDRQGLAAALERLAQKFRADLGLAATFHSDASKLALPASVQHLLLRIAQEALFNAWKHAQAGGVELQLTSTRGELTLTISDNGVGFDPQHVPGGHFGLESMRARANALGAALAIDSAPGQG